jgi:hypothetical protein
VVLAEYLLSPAEFIPKGKAWRHRDESYEHRITCGPLGDREDERILMPVREELGYGQEDEDPTQAGLRGAVEG